MSKANYKFEVTMKIDEDDPIFKLNGFNIKNNKSSFLDTIIRYGLHYDGLEETKVVGVKEI